MIQEKVSLIITIILLISRLYSSTPGILNVGFDIDDTILFSRDVFLNIPENKRNPIDYGWVNRQDQKLSLFIEPTLDLISYFKNNGHEIYFITARSGENGDYLAKFLSDSIEMDIIKDKNLFFCPKEIINGKRYTTKHHQMRKLNLDLFYGDADTDMIAALKANVHPIRIVRHKKSIEQYGKNYFGNVLKGKSKKSPFEIDDLKIFYSKSVGIYGESIYPIIWKGP